MNERILLTRVVAVNWYGFNQIIDVDDTTLISGPTGKGKSALLDLMQYVLLGEGWKANRAASGTKARGRDLVGYCLCDSNHERGGERHFMRQSGATVIALEFTKPSVSGEEPELETWGVRIEYSSPSSQPRRTWFMVPERLDYGSILDADGESLLDEERFRTWLRREFGHDCLFSRQKDYLEQMATARHLNFDRKSFDLTFPKAIAFEPEQNVESFIREFILEASPLNVTEVRHSLLAYEDVRKRLENQEDEAGYLRKICKHDEDCRAAERRAAVLEHVGILLRKARKKETFRKLDDEVKRLDQSLEEDKRRKNEAIEERGRIEGRLEEARSALDADPDAKKLKGLRDRITQLEDDLGALKEARKSVAAFLNSRRKHWVEWLSHGASLRLEGWEEAVEGVHASVEALSRGEETQALEQLDPLAKAFPVIKQVGTEAARRLDDRISEFKEQEKRLQGDLDRIEEGNAPGVFPVFDALRERFGNEVSQLRHMVEVREEAEDWWPVLESLLGDERWTILVKNPETFRAASDLLAGWEKRSNEADFAREALLHPEEVPPAEMNPAADGVLKKIEANDPTAMARLSQCIGDIACAPDPAAAESAGVARVLSPDGYFKDTPVRRRLPTEGVFFTLGQRGLARMKKRLEEEQNEKKGKREGLERRRDDIKIWIDRGLEKSLGSDRRPDRSEGIERISKLEEDVDSDKATLQLLETPERMERVRKVGQATAKLQQLDEQIGALKSKLDERGRTLDSKRMDMDKVGEDLEQISREVLIGRAELAAQHHGLTDEEIESERSRIFADSADWAERERALSRSIQAAGNAVVEHRGDRNNHRRALMEARDERGYHRHSIYRDFPFDADDNSPWRERLTRLEDVELEKNRQLADSRRKEWQDRLRDQVLNELTRRTREAEAVIRSLDRHLREPVGNHRYAIRQRRDPAYANVWRLLDSGFEGSDPLAQALQEAGAKAALKELMDAVHAGADARDKAARLLDYRSYHHYDIEMIPRDSESGKGISLSRSGRNLSGGESQAPFFISMLAAFQRVYDRGESRARRRARLGLVVMDEAFSKLSSDGITDCLNLARSFGLQLVLAFPPEKLGVMIEHARTVVVCQKETEYDAEGLPSLIENIPVCMTLDEAMEALD